MHYLLVVHLLNCLPNLPHNLRGRLDVKLLVVGIHQLKQVAPEEFVDKGSLFVVFVNMQSQALAALKRGVVLLAFLIYDVRHALYNECLVTASRCILDQLSLSSFTL